MLRTRLALVTLLVGALVVVASASAATPTLTGVVGPGFSITLKKGTAKVTSVKAGKYKIVIKDLSNIHNFHLSGPGLNKKTSVGAKGRSAGRSRSRRGRTSTSVIRTRRS